MRPLLDTPVAMTRPTPRQLVIWFLAPALLVGVAGVHSYFVAAKNQTPWEGGGFGMFSTVDKRQARFVRCYLVTPEREVLVRTPSHLETYVQRLRVRPTPERAEGLARYLARATWVVAADSGATDVPPGDTTRAGLYRYLSPHEASSRRKATVEAVRVEVWRYRFESRPYRLSAHRLLTATGRPPDG